MRWKRATPRRASTRSSSGSRSSSRTRRRTRPRSRACSRTSIRRAVTSRAALARVPVTRKSDLADLQKAARPFGGLAATGWGGARAGVKRVFASPGPIYEPEGATPDYWRLARALYAAGFRAGDLVHNTFAYHFTPAGSMLETGAHALGCTVFPAGTGQTEQQVQAMADLQARRVRRHAVVPQDHPREGRRGRHADARACARRSCPAKRSRRACATRSPRAASRPTRRMRPRTWAASRTRRPRARGSSSTRACWSRSCAPAPAIRCAPGEVGEVVVTALVNTDYPLIRFGTGDLSALPARRLALRTHERPHQGMDGARGPDDEGEGHVRAPVAGRRDREAASRDREGAPRRRQSGRAGPDDAARRGRPRTRRRTRRRSSRRSAR